MKEKIMSEEVMRIEEETEDGAEHVDCGISSQGRE